MALNYVNLTADLFDGQGNVLAAGTATFTPTAQLTDTADHEIVTLAPVTAAFKPTASPVVKLLATDNGAPLPGGWGWTVTFSGVPGNPASFTFFLPFAAGASQFLSSQAPVSSAAVLSPALARKAATPAAGFALQNGTPTILSWAVPSDGQQHPVTVFASIGVTSPQTGGGVICNATAPDGTSNGFTIFGGGLGAGFRANTATVASLIVGAGSAVTLQQQSAQTGGAALVWAELWGA